MIKLCTIGLALIIVAAIGLASAGPSCDDRTSEEDCFKCCRGYGFRSIELPFVDTCQCSYTNKGPCSNAQNQVACNQCCTDRYFNSFDWDWDFNDCTCKDKQSVPKPSKSNPEIVQDNDDLARRHSRERDELSREREQRTTKFMEYRMKQQEEFEQARKKLTDEFLARRMREKVQHEEEIQKLTNDFIERRQMEKDKHEQQMQELADELLDRQRKEREQRDVRPQK